jgi:hypothetical protein
MRLLTIFTTGILFVSWVYAETFEVGVHWKNYDGIPKRLVFKFIESSFEVNLGVGQELHLQSFPHHEALDHLTEIGLEWDRGVLRREIKKSSFTLNPLDNKLPLLNIYLGSRPRGILWTRKSKL